MRSNQSSNRNALNAKNASRSARIGCICAPVKRAARHSAATARQTIMRANTRTPADIRSSRLRSSVSAGCTVILTMPSLSIKLWRFVYRSCRLKRFHKCCSHRFAAGRIRPVCGPVAGPPRRSSFTLGRRPTRLRPGYGVPSRAVATEAIQCNCEYRMPRVLLFSLTNAVR